VGQDFVKSLLEQFGWDTELIEYRRRLWLAAGFPIVELVIGCGLLFSRTRATAAVLAIVMHSCLLWILGPFGLQHAAGVLVWNALFIVLCCFMFLWPFHDPSATSVVMDRASASQIHARGSNRRLAAIDVLLILVLAVPSGERLGLIDHWLGWALYAPHSSRAHIEISASAVARLPDVVQPFVECDPESLWCTVRADQWSLATLHAPITPQQRFQVGVARALAKHVNEHEIRVTLLSTAGRWSGRRMEQELRGASELNSAGRKYWYNTTPHFLPILD
jgi:hypothetical protein